MKEFENLFADGKAYEQRMGRWSRPVGEAFLDWLAVPPGLRWLDVGCGNGAFTEVLIARRAPQAVTGIDPSEGQLAYARTRPGAEAAQFRIGDAQSLPFADDSFDAAAMALVISFLADPVKAAAEMARVVRSGGLVAAYMWDIPGGGLPVQPIYAALQSLGIGLPPAPGAAVSQRHALQEVWEKAGLQSIDTRVIRIPIVYSDFEEFWESNTAPVGPNAQLLRDLSPDAKEQLRKRLRETLPAAPDGRIAFEAFANAVKGRS
jgi:ubiquinone/menaquinone biosynthesis C-methylase UbiE